MKAIGRDDMADDPRFKSDMDRFNSVDLIDPIVRDWVGQRTSDEVRGLLRNDRVPCSVMNTVDQLLTDPQVKAREMINFIDYPNLGEVPVPGIPIKLSLTPGSIKTPAPQVGEHNEEIYCGLLGFSPEKVLTLKQKEII